MDHDAVIGCIILVAVLVVMLGLVAWSRRLINTIARKDVRNIRDIAQEMDRER